MIISVLPLIIISIYCLKKILLNYSHVKTNITDNNISLFLNILKFDIEIIVMKVIQYKRLPRNILSVCF